MESVIEQRDLRATATLIRRNLRAWAKRRRHQIQFVDGWALVFNGNIVSIRVKYRLGDQQRVRVLDSAL